MQVTIEDVSPVEKKLDVEIPWERVLRKLDEAYRDLSRGVKLRGFRPGKVPRSVLEKMFGKTVQQEVLSKLVTEGFVQVAQEQNLRPVAEPVVDDAKMPEKAGQPLKFTARVEVRGEIPAKDYKSIALKRRKSKVSDGAIDEVLSQKRSELAEYKAVEGRDKLSDKDVIITSLKGVAGGIKVDREEMRIDLGSPDREPVPGLIKALIGKPLAEKNLSLSYDMPKDHPRPEIAGKNAQFKLEVKEVLERVLPALDDEFAKDTGDADTLKDLRDKIRTDLLAQDQKQAERELKQEAIKALLAKNEFQVAPALVERQLEVAVERARIQAMLAGMDVERDFDVQGVKDKLRPSALDEVRATLLLDAIAEVENVDVSDEDLDTHLAAVAASRKTNVQKLKAEWSREGRLEAIRHGLREDKALDLVLSQAKITEEKGT